MPCLSFHDILVIICTKWNERLIQLLGFRSTCATEVSGYLIRKCSFSLHCAYFVKIIHVRHETNFGSTRVLFYCSLPSRITAKTPCCVPQETLWLVTGSHSSTAGEGTGRWTHPYPPDCFLLCSADTVANTGSVLSMWKCNRMISFPTQPHQLSMNLSKTNKSCR